MSVLYIETATYLKKDLEWTWYTYDEERVKVWEKYISSYGDLTLIAPYEKEVCNKKTKGLIKLGNIYGLEKKHITLEYVDDLYENKFNMLNRKLKEEISNLIARKIKYKGFEVIVIGKDKNFYQRQAIKYAKKFKKQYEIN